MKRRGFIVSLSIFYLAFRILSVFALFSDGSIEYEKSAASYALKSGHQEVALGASDEKRLFKRPIAALDLLLPDVHPHFIVFGCVFFCLLLFHFFLKNPEPSLHLLRAPPAFSL